MNLGFLSANIYAHCQTEQEFEETRQRINLWLLCELDPETAMEYIRRTE